MLKKNFILFIIILFFIQSCATPPNKVLPLNASVSINRECSYYEEQLADAKKDEQRLEEYQKELRSNDKTYAGLAIGLGIFIWPLAFLAFGIKGDDSSTLEYGLVKGKVKRLDELVNETCN